MAHQPPDVLEVRGLKRSIAESVFFDQLSFSVRTGDVLFVRGPSGVGKSLLLRCLACLDDHQGGQLLLNGRSPDQLGYPAWRSSVTYVSQARISLKGTPAELYFQAGQFAAQKARTRERGDLPALVHDLGMEQVVLNQEWGELSGGQFQRMLLAIAVALRPSVLLLDEPTSACDQASALRVERVLRDSGLAIVWVSHDREQPYRVGGRVLELPMGLVSELLPPLQQHAMPTAPSASEQQQGSLRAAQQQHAPAAAAPAAVAWRHGSIPSSTDGTSGFLVAVANGGLS